MSDLDVKEIRKNLRLTQQAFADKLGVSRNTVLNYEKGETIPHSKSIILHTMLTESKISDAAVYFSDSKTKKESIPLLPIDAFAGIGESNVTGVNFDTIEERYVVPLFNGMKVDFMIPVRGSSMYPKYSSGDVVACRLVNDLLFVQWNKVYVIDSVSQGIMMKRLKKSEKDQYMICKSDNKEYDEFEVPKEDIRSIALVVGVIRLE